MGLFGKTVPKTAGIYHNPIAGGKGKSREPLSYKGSTFHRIIPQFVIQGGHFTRGDGRSGESIYGEKFEDERFKLKHTGPGKSTISNQIVAAYQLTYFPLFSLEWERLEVHHVVFGKVLSGMDIVHKIEGQSSGVQESKIIIVDNGEMHM
ncbi:unnamed protein product [Linum tenue]|uniref:Peptidyl-prolyl cis-trans isomerase n=1 Tax=Linum tenue TaxID=586396 RepID=A0AAV0K3J8_9ROSI|nr:unnamed protein product [Linum tenue]